MNSPYADFEDHALDDGHHFFVGRLPTSLRPDAGGFESLWTFHPGRHYIIQRYGRPVETPLWQQAYGVDYHDTVRTNAALPIPIDMDQPWGWARRAINDRLHGLLVNWYDGGSSGRSPGWGDGVGWARITRGRRPAARRSSSWR